MRAALGWAFGQALVIEGGTIRRHHIANHKYTTRDETHDGGVATAGSQADSVVTVHHRPTTQDHPGHHAAFLLRGVHGMLQAVQT
jgi:hypothetical protein